MIDKEILPNVHSALVQHLAIPTVIGSGRGEFSTSTQTTLKQSGLLLQANNELSHKHNQSHYRCHCKVQTHAALRLIDFFSN